MTQPTSTTPQHPGATRWSIPDAEVDRILSECVAAINGKVAPSPDGFLLTSKKITRVTAAQAAAILEGQRKPRRPTLASVAKQASKAAIPVARYEVKPDSTIVVVTGEPEPAKPENPWLVNLPKRAQR